MLRSEGLTPGFKSPNPSPTQSSVWHGQSMNGLDRAQIKNLTKSNILWLINNIFYGFKTNLASTILFYNMIYVL